MTVLNNLSLDARFTLVINIYLQHQSLFVYLPHQQHLKILMVTTDISEAKADLKNDSCFVFEQSIVFHRYIIDALLGTFAYLHNLSTVVELYTLF